MDPASDLPDRNLWNTKPMDDLFPTTRQNTRLTRRQFRAILSASGLLVACLLIGLGWYLKDLRAASIDQEHQQEIGELADRFGIQITLIGINQGMGVIELRYQILDPDKALEVGDGQANYPTLIAEKDGTVLYPPPATSHHHKNVEMGRTHFFFINNRNGVLSPGDQVTLLLGDVRVRHLIVH